MIGPKVMFSKSAGLPLLQQVRHSLTRAIKSLESPLLEERARKEPSANMVSKLEQRDVRPLNSARRPKEGFGEATPMEGPVTLVLRED